MICRECESEEIEEGEDGFFYCQQCGVQADDIIGTAVADEDFIGEGGDTRGAIYNPINTRRKPSQQIASSQPRHTQETIRYSQFRSQLESASQIPQSAFVPSDLFREVKREPNTEPIEPIDFGEESTDLTYQDYYEEVRDRYVNGFLMMVTYQCDALVETFNVTPLITGLVPQMVLRFVALSGVYDDDWADKAVEKSEIRSEEKGEVVREVKRERNKGEPKNFFDKRAVTIWVSELRKSMPLSSTLALSFLACNTAGAPILPTEIVRWVQEGKIPYLSSFLRIQKEMGERSAACPVKASTMFRPSQVVSAQMLEARAAVIAEIIGLTLSPVNFYGIASNYLKRLSIPEDKVLDRVRLIQNWAMPPELYMSKNELKLPTRVCVMSIIVVAIRMLYNINGFGVWERNLESDNDSETDDVTEEPDSPIHDDDEEVSENNPTVEESSDITEPTKAEIAELLKKLEARYYDIAAETLEYKKDLESYLSHGKKEVFAGLEGASADDTYRTIDKLCNVYPKVEKYERFETPSKRGRDREIDLSLNQLSLNDDTEFSDENNLCSSPSRRSESGSMDHDQCSSKHQVSSPENHNQEENSKDGSIRRLITDMGENLFQYIPPRVKVKREKSYLHYVRKREDGALIYAAHADYYILLRVCACVAEIDARNMHRGVLSFERRLGWIEKRIDQVVYLTPPSMTCDHCCDGGNVAEDEDDFNFMVSSQPEKLIL